MRPSAIDGVEICRVIKDICRTCYSEARADAAPADDLICTCSIIDCGGIQVSALPALFIIVRHLKQRCGFARIHRGKSEVEFGQKNFQC